MASWFTGLAGKAEALLERVDQTAADRLKTPVKDTSNQANRVVDTPERPLSVEREGTVSSGLFSPVQSGLPRVASEGVLSTGRDVRSSSRSGRKSPTPSVTASLGRPKSSQLQRVSVTDEQLFEFLNAPRRESKPSPKPVLEWTSVSDSRETLNPVKSGLTVSRLDHMEGSVDSNDLEDVTDGEGGRQQTDISMPLAGTIEQGLKERVSNLELENRLLKREVTSLNQELTNVSERARHAEKHLSDARNEMEGSRQVSSRSDQLVREMHGRHDDLVQTLATRDAQIAVLRVKLQEADEKSDSNDQKVKLLKVENERVLRDHSDSQGVQQQVLEELRQKLEETENSLRDQRAVLAVSQTQTIHQQTQLESERHQLSGSLKETQRKLTEEKLRLNEQAQAVKNARTDTESARRELSEYKEKAQRILQSKDRLINELKTGVSGSDTTSFSGAVAAEVEQMRKERDLMREEAHASQLQLDHLRMELQDAEQHHQVEMDEKSERLRELEESLDDERRRREVAEQEAARRLHEVEYTQTELFREKTALQSRLHERENEVQKLKSQLTTRAAVSVGQSELESRIHSLTENLIQKQTVIEALTSEKMSLSMQLERTQSNLTKVQSERPVPQKMNGPTVLQGFDEDSGGARMRPILSSDMSFADQQETNFKRGVRRAANTIDRFSIQFGRFLRVYPSARVFLLLYMLLLHLWVLFVLLTYSPEIHPPTTFT